jgi:hypothetical protein
MKTWIIIGRDPGTGRLHTYGRLKPDPNDPPQLTGNGSCPYPHHFYFRGDADRKADHLRGLYPGFKISVRKGRS